MGLAEVMTILITADDAGAVQAFGRIGKSAERDLGKAQTEADKAGSSMQKYGAAAVGVGAVLEVAAYKAAQAASEHQVAVDKLDNSIENSTAVAKSSSDAFQGQAEALAKTTVISRDQTIAGQAMLVQMGATQQQVTSLTPLIGDISRKMGIDMVTASKAVGMALDGHSAALKRLKVPLDDALYKTDHYAAITEALGHAQGFAAEEGQTFGGQVEITKNQLHEFEQGVGVGAASALGHFNSVVQDATGALHDMGPGAESVVGQVAAYGGALLVAGGATSVLAGAVVKSAQNISGFRELLAGKTAATEADTVATEANAAAEGSATGASTAHAAAASGEAAAVAEEGAAAEGAAAANMTLAGALTAVGAGAVIGLTAGTKMLADADKASGDMFKGIDFTDLEGANQKLNQTGDEINANTKKWNEYNTAEQVVHYSEGVALDKAQSQQAEFRNRLDATTNSVKKAGEALGISATEAEKLFKELKIDPTQVGWDKLRPELEGYLNHTKTAAQVTQDLGGDVADAGAEAETSAKELKDLDSSTMGLVDAQHAYADAQTHVSDAQAAVQSAEQRVGDARQAVADATARVTDAQRAYEDSGKRVTAAQQAEVDALQKVQDAVNKVADAERALQTIQSGGTHGDDYALGKEEAQLRLKEATEATAALQKKVQDAKTPADKLAAENALEQNHIDILRAQNGVLDANGQQAKDAANAQTQLTAAQDAVTAAEKSATNAADAVTKAQEEQQKAADGVARAQRDVGRASEGVAAAQQAVVKAQEGVSRAQWDEFKSLDALINKQNDEKTALVANSAAVDDLIARYQLLGPAGAAAVTVLGGGTPAASNGSHWWDSAIPHHAGGGSLGAGLSEVNEFGTELLHQGGKDYLLSSGGGGVITPAGGFNVGGGGGTATMEVTVPVYIDGRKVAEAMVPHTVILERGRR